MCKSHFWDFTIKWAICVGVLVGKACGAKYSLPTGPQWSPWSPVKFHSLCNTIALGAGTVVKVSYNLNIRNIQEYTY